MAALHKHAKRQLEPPFSKSNELCPTSQVILPSVVRRDTELIQPQNAVQDFLKSELLTPKLDALHDCLWLAGLPVPARHLQRQSLMNRNISLTERPDEHLVWYDGCIFVKPLPAFLLCHSFWSQHLCGPEPEQTHLRASALGLLLSYTWLIQYPSDLEAARQLSLLPPLPDAGTVAGTGLGYAAWTRFAADVVSHVDLVTLAQVDRRYRYGELRLTRLNALTRFLPRKWTVRKLVYGHMSFSTRYRAFFDTNFGWLLATFAYISVILSALQVGLGTELLVRSVVFQSMSYVLSVAALVAAFASVVWLMVVFLVLLVYHLSSTYVFVRSLEVRRGKVV